MADYDLTNSCADIDAVLVASDHMLQYVCDPSEADQGVAGNGNSLKDLIDDIGTSKQATIYLLHHAADGNTTTYTVTTAESVPDNIKLNISEGAIIGGAGTLTFDSPGQIISGYKQELFGSSVDIKFTIAGLVYVQWWNGSAGDGSTECATAVQAAVDSVVSHSATALKVMFPPGDYVISSEIATEKNIWIAGEGESSYLDFSSLGVALSAFEFDSAGNPIPLVSAKNDAGSETAILELKNQNHMMHAEAQYRRESVYNYRAPIPDGSQAIYGREGHP